MNAKSNRCSEAEQKDWLTFVLLCNFFVTFPISSSADGWKGTLEPGMMNIIIEDGGWFNSSSLIASCYMSFTQNELRLARSKPRTDVPDKHFVLASNDDSKTKNNCKRSDEQNCLVKQMICSIRLYCNTYRIVHVPRKTLSRIC